MLIIIIIIYNQYSLKCIVYLILFNYSCYLLVYWNYLFHVFVSCMLILIF